jgi:hypothetical protein
MQPLRLRLKPGTDPESAREALHEQIQAGTRVTPAGVGTTPFAETNLRLAYIDWADATEGVLQNFTFETDMTTALHTERYWHIRHGAGLRGHRWSMPSSDNKRTG